MIVTTEPIKKPILAAKTVALFDSMVQADQGRKFRGLLQKVLPHIGDAYRQDEEPFRSHLGASIVGQECARAIWYGFRWATMPNFPGRIMRLFNRGHLEEARLIALLLMIGCEVYQQDANGKQFRISHAEGHMGGSGDGVVMHLPDLPPASWCLTEFKTHSDKSFNDVKAQGVRLSKFEHFVQQNIYMRKMDLPVSLYLAVNKNTDEIYGELVPLDTSIADQFLDRGNNIVWLHEPPKRINASPGFYKCKFCDHRPVCHLKVLPHRNCRTCRFSAPAPGGVWLCNQHSSEISKEVMFDGCSGYKVHEAFGC